jgi:23S rRNA pseudouridine955/2504/2580 synthase/23S rRNA pseudouridine1911/1915/1917 synthase
MHLHFLYRDLECVAVDKPAPLLTLPDRFDHAQPSLIQILRKQFDEIFVVHRLDRETSGVILFALTAAAHRELSQMFEHRDVDKTYLALVHGELTQDEGTIDAAIRENSSRPGSVQTHPSGKPSLTTFSVVERFRGYTLVEARPRTGRLHQIRIHFSSIGHPLAVDAMYGGQTGLYLSSIKRGYRPKPGQDEKPLIGRATLHASSISFKHPSTGAMIKIGAPLPKDFRSVLQHLRKWQ